jgi:hypothetical protein
MSKIGYRATTIKHASQVPKRTDLSKKDAPRTPTDEPMLREDKEPSIGEDASISSSSHEKSLSLSTDEKADEGEETNIGEGGRVSSPPHEQDNVGKGEATQRVKGTHGGSSEGRKRERGEKERRCDSTSGARRIQ